MREMKTFTSASVNNNGDMEVYFSDGSRFDIPLPEWWAIVHAARYYSPLAVAIERGKLD
jgi:hypothetical protein